MTSPPVFNFVFTSIVFSFSLLFLTSSFARPADSSCQQIEKRCLEGAETRTIAGTNIYRSCWKWQTVYSCARKDPKNYCTQLEKQDDCRLKQTTCTRNKAGICTLRQNTFVCDKPLSPRPYTITLIDDKRVIVRDDIKSNCSSLSTNGQCRKVQDKQCIEGYETRMINGLSVTKACWKWQTRYSCGGSSQSDCAKIQSRSDCRFSHETVLSRDSNGTPTYTEKVFTCKGSARFAPNKTVCSSSYGFAGIKENVVRPQSKDFAGAATFLNVLQRASKDKDVKVKNVFLGMERSCSKTLASSLFFNCCSDDGLLTAIGLVHCSPEAVDLQNRLQRGQAKYVGSYCKNSIPIIGICLQKVKSYCVFKSKLARIIHEQGRAQLGIGWGGAAAPNCRGFTLLELRQLDFSKIDLSEFLEDSDVIKQRVLDRTMEQNLQQRIKDYYTNKAGSK